VADFQKELWADYEALPKDQRDDDYAKTQLKQLAASYSEDKGVIVKFEKPNGFNSKYMWFPNRQAPDEDVKGLARLKGHLQKGKWLTKFRKIIRKDEMAEDLVLVPVKEGEEQDYTRIMPTSPP